jgi:hypothetical protein
MKMDSLISNIKVNTLRNVSQGIDLFRQHLGLSLSFFILLLLVFFFPYLFGVITGRFPDYNSVHNIVIVYYPFRILMPPILVGLYSYRMRNAMLAVSLGIGPLLLLALSELPWKPFLAVVQEDILLAVVLMLLAIGLGPLLRKPNNIGVYFAAIGVILWIGIMMPGILNYFKNFA